MLVVKLLNLLLFYACIVMLSATYESQVIALVGGAALGTLAYYSFKSKGDAK